MPSNLEPQRRAALVALGDLGRSPRMQYHALALAEQFTAVDFIGYGGRPCLAAVESHPRIRLHRIPEPALAGRHDLPRFVFLVTAAGRVFAQLARLLWLLLRIDRPDLLIVQNPPAIPSLAVGVLVARLRRVRLIVDWHNLGFTVLGLRLGDRHPVVRLARSHEGWFARRADGHLCVSQAMRQALQKEFGVGNAIVMHDRPGPQFARLTGEQRVDTLRRFAVALDWPDLAACAVPPGPLLVVAPTSWTADEDFDLLLDAMDRFDRAAPTHSLLVAITGDGPRRRRFEDDVGRRRLQRVQVRTLWLDPIDYPLLLGSADLGISLHRSSSGVDLPMKVMDMRGAGVPVCALDYGPVLAEQVTAGVDGLLFKSAAELSDLLLQSVRSPAELQRLRGGVPSAGRTCWAEEWSSAAELLG